MQRVRYDGIGDFYIHFAQDGLRNPHSLISQLTRFLLVMMGDARDKRVLDLCCGEGHLAFELARRGARVTGVDLSAVNLAAARRQTTATDNPTFVLDDAQHLAAFDAAQFDVVVCKMALMDVPDIDALFRSVRRVLKPGGCFYAALLHPCFETPFCVPFEPVETDDAGRFRHHRVQRYFEEGLWRSGGSGVRGHVGAHHRTLSTYVNALVVAGLPIARLAEPQLAVGEPGSLARQWAGQVPKILFMKAK